MKISKKNFMNVYSKQMQTSGRLRMVVEIFYPLYNLPFFNLILLKQKGTNNHTKIPNQIDFRAGQSATRYIVQKKEKSFQLRLIQFIYFYVNYNFTIALTYGPTERIDISAS